MFLAKITLVAIIMALPLSAFAERNELIWCLGHLPSRHHYVSDKPPHGPMIDFMQELSSRLDLNLVYTVPTPLQRCLNQLKQGEVDVVTGLLLTEER